MEGTAPDATSFHIGSLSGEPARPGLRPIAKAVDKSWHHSESSDTEALEKQRSEINKRGRQKPKTVWCVMCTLEAPLFPGGNEHGMKTMALFLQERTMAGKSWRFPAGKGPWLENHDAFLQERIMAGKSWRFPAGKDHGWKIMTLSCRKGLWSQNYRNSGRVRASQTNLWHRFWCKNLWKITKAFS